MVCEHIITSFNKILLLIKKIKNKTCDYYFQNKQNFDRDSIINLEEETKNHS